MGNNLKALTGQVQVHSVAEKRRLEFLQKNQILEQYYNVVDPLEFLESVFGNLNQEHCIVFGKKDNQKGSVERIILEDVIDFFQFDNVYIPYCSFFYNYPKSKLAKTLYAFCIDLDYIKPRYLQFLIECKIKLHKIKPTYLYNSGQGVHLVYVLAEPIELYHSIKNKCDKILKNLRKKFIIKGQNKNTKKIYKVDSLRLTQPYRIPGSLTKLGQVSLIYKSGRKIEISELADWCGIKMKKPKKTKTIIKGKKKNNIEYLPNGNLRFYQHCLMRCFEEVQEGHRYLSMFALAIVAWKCRVPKSELQKALWALVEWWNDPDNPYFDFSHPIKPQEVEKALSGYNQKATLCPKERLEEWFGFKFNPPKRNGRKRNEHLKRVHAERKGKTRELVRLYLEANPGAPITEIAKVSGISRPTIYRYGKELGLI
jgi:hypothetical protein